MKVTEFSLTLFSTHLTATCLLVAGIQSCKVASTNSAVRSDNSDLQAQGFTEIDYENLDATMVRADILGIPFGDTALNEFDTARNIGPNNASLQDDFVLRFAHLAEAHSPDLEAMGFETCFPYSPQRRQSQKNYRPLQSGPGEVLPIGAEANFRFAQDTAHSLSCFFQRVALPDSNEFSPSEQITWRTDRTPPGMLPPPVISLFLPNVMAIYLDTTGTWPFGQRPSDQMPARFAALFLKMGGDCSGAKDLEPPPTFAGKVEEGIHNFFNPPVMPQLSAREKCDLESLNRVSNGAQAKLYHAYTDPDQVSDAFGAKVKADPQNLRPAIPFNPPRHVWYEHYQIPVDKRSPGSSGNPADSDYAQEGRHEGFLENKFPFLWPPNEGKGYFQKVSGGKY